MMTRLERLKKRLGKIMAYDRKEKFINRVIILEQF